MTMQPEKLSNVLRTMRDQFRGHEIADGQVIISGEALSSLVQTLEFATEAARAMEQQLASYRCREQHRGRVVPFPPRHSARRHSPWRPNPAAIPGHVSDSDDDGGSAA